MRKKIVAANWKMNMLQAEAAEFVKDLLLEIGDMSAVEVVIVPPFTAIAKVVESLDKAQNIKVGAQNARATPITPPLHHWQLPARFVQNCADRDWRRRPERRRCLAATSMRAHFPPSRCRHIEYERDRPLSHPTT